MSDAIAAAEIVSTESGKVLWVERYIFSRAHGVGETFIRDSKTYRVSRAAVTKGEYRGVLIEYVVQELGAKATASADGDPTLSQKMKDQGFVRHSTKQPLPSDE